MAIKKNRMAKNEERNSLIEHMNLDELKKYLCMKNYQNPEKCNGCPGIRNCKAGQRAIVLLNERDIQKMEETMEVNGNPQKGKSVVDRVEMARKKFIRSLSEPDMIQYLIDNEGNNRNSAREKLKHWGRVYPDIAEQFNFWDRFNALSKKMPTNLRSLADKKTIEAMERYKEAVQHDDPIAFMMEKYGIERGKAVHNFRQWKTRYGEIDVKKEESTEEISVEDFLKENEVTEEAEQEEINKVEKQQKFRLVDNIIKGTSISGELEAKIDELEREKERLMERLSWIEKAQRALRTTAEIFKGEVHEQEHYADGEKVLVLRKGGIS